MSKKLPVSKKVLSQIPLVGSVLAPGEGASEKDQEATAQWRNLQPPDQANLTYGEQAADPGQGSIAFNGAGVPIFVPPGQAPPPGFTAGPPELTNIGAHPEQAGDIMPYDVGDPLAARHVQRLNSKSMAGMNINPTSNWQGWNSAFEGAGPSNWQDATSAFKDLGPSAGANIEFNKGALAGEQGGADYFSRMSQTGNDPIAEADYQRRVAQAEQSRKQNQDAALASLETKGLGNAGGQLMARTQGAQDEANARYQAGLDTAATASARRDFAARTGADISHTMGGDILSADEKRATLIDAQERAKRTGEDVVEIAKRAGLDKHDIDVMTGKDKADVSKNQGLDTERENRIGDYYHVAGGNAAADTAADITNFNRRNSTSDANTGLGNQTTTFNKVTAPQNAFGNAITKAGGVSSGLQTEAGQSSANDAALTSNIKSIAGGIAGIPPSGGGGGGAAAGGGGAPANPWQNWSPYASNATPPVRPQIANPYG